MESDLAIILNELPENRPLYKDSGLWQIRTDDLEDVLYEQEVCETFYAFIFRVHQTEQLISQLNT